MSKNEMIMLPRKVVQQALEAFNVATTPLARDRQEVLKAIEALRAALEQQPVSIPDDLPHGFVPLQREKGRIVYAACLDGGRFNGWLMWKHPGGQWVSKRKLEDWEIMQAEDQRDYGIVQGD